MPKKIDRDDYLIVEPYESWLNSKPGKGFFDDSFYRIINFYVLHSPCKVSSYSPITLESLGWKNPWNSSRFRDTFDKIAGFASDESFYYHESKNHFLELWKQSGFEFFPSEDLSEYAVLIHAGESNPRMDLLHHIRNSLAHGRFSVVKDNREYYLFFEDVATIRGLNGALVVNSRVCLKKSTLIAWIDFFEQKKYTDNFLSLMI